MNEYTTPLVITCCVTGRKQKLYHRPYIDKLIAKHGSLEKLLAEYKCKGAKSKIVLPVVAPQNSIAAAVEIVAPAARVAPADKLHTSYPAGETIDGEPMNCNVYEDKS